MNSQKPEPGEKEERQDGKSSEENPRKPNPPLLFPSFEDLPWDPPPKTLSGVFQVKTEVPTIPDMMGKTLTYRVVVEDELELDAVVDSGSTITLISLKFLVEVAKRVGTRKYRTRGQPVGREFFNYDQRPIPGLRICVPVLMKIDGKTEEIPCVVNEDPQCLIPLLLGTAALEKFGFSLDGPSGTSLWETSTHEQDPNSGKEATREETPQPSQDDPKPSLEPPGNSVENRFVIGKYLLERLYCAQEIRKNKIKYQRV